MFHRIYIMRDLFAYAIDAVSKKVRLPILDGVGADRLAEFTALTALYHVRAAADSYDEDIDPSVYDAVEILDAHIMEGASYPKRLRVGMRLHRGTQRGDQGSEYGRLCLELARYLMRPAGAPPETWGAAIATALSDIDLEPGLVGQAFWVALIGEVGTACQEQWGELPTGRAAATRADSLRGYKQVTAAAVAAGVPVTQVARGLGVSERWVHYQV